MDTTATDTGTRLKEHLYRAEAERLLLQQKAAVLDGERQQLSADVHTLQQQLAAAHAAFVTAQQHNQQLSADNAKLQVQVEAAVREYRANDIICCGLRDTISRLQRHLADSQETCRQQAQEISTFAADMQELRHCKVDLTQQVSDLQRQHQQLQADHATSLKQLSDAELELQDSKRRWLDEHGDMARMVQDIQESKQQLQAAMEEQAKQLEEHKQQLKDQQAKCAEFEAEVGSVRDIVMVLGKAIGKQPRGQELPSHEDPVWAKLGPLGGVQFALEVVMKHTRAQDAKVKGMSSELSRLEDRVRSESAQQAELQAGLYEVRGLYAKAISDRESLEARAARAEAEKAAADTNWQRAKAQAAEDSARLAELQESVMSLTKQVQQLLPLQPRCSTLEVERDTAQHKLDRLQEQHDQLQRQQQQAVAREGELRASLDTYKTEHMQLLNANAQLVEKCQSLNKRVQVLEISTREGNLAVGQLEETKKRLCSTQNQLDAMSDSHARTLSRLETAKKLLHGTPGSSEPSSGGNSPHSPRSRKSSRHTSGVGAAPDCAPLPGDQAAAAAAVAVAAAAAGAARAAGGASCPLSPCGPSGGPCTGPDAPAADNCSAANPTGTSSISRAASAHNQLRQRSSGVGAAATSESAGYSRRSRPASPYQDDEQAELINEDEVANLPPEVAQLLKRKGLEERLSSKQKKWHDMKVSVLSYFSNQLRKQLLQQTERSAKLELQLLEQEAQQLKVMQQQEEAATRQCMAAAADASAALQQVLADLRQVMSGEDAPGSNDTATAAAAAAAAAASSAYGAHEGSSSEGAAAQMQNDDDAASCSAGATSAGSDSTVVSSITAGATSTANADSAQRGWNIDGREAPDSVEQKQGVAGRKRSGWLHTAVSTMIGDLQTVAAEAVARAELIASRQEVAVQSDETQQTEWLHYVTSIHAGGITHMLHEKAVAEAIVRIYIRALHQLEATWGPISRLLASCQSLAGSSAKVALFCRLVGSCRQPGRAAWGAEHWQHFLLVLHAVKRLIGGLWKGVLRDWASTAGARLPLQCVHDLLGNVYNVSYLAELDRLPALLNTRQPLLEQPAGCAAAAAREQTPAEPGSGSSRSSREAGSVPSSRHQRGSVSSALRELLVDGPVGPAVDLDDLLAMIMLQFDAGLLPPNPLMEPRRLTDGSLANKNNAWGQAALELASSSSGAGQARAGSKLGMADGAAPDRADSSRSDWYLPSSMSGVSSAGGWLSRPATGAAAAASRVGTAAAGSPLPGELSSPAAASGLLPRIRTPDSAAPGGGRPSSSGGAAGSLPAMASYNAALPEVVSSSGSSTAAGSLGSPVSRSPTASASRVAFREAPGGPASSKARTASAMKKPSSIQLQGRPGGQ
ncbi:hypothetical protein OEZ85_008495 [Tetradesmus obliquus]|uniref:Dilute domain-containing protein n=1 Tax=Tetradesmus obliquus TaxID=3088 RepID=A0ABY8TJ04_TETOB|nr:hypothetical protein OEZ85_008495 [Tetradesmus obliquus]